MTRQKLAIVFVAWFLACVWINSTDAQQQPNILWLTSEDHGPAMGCYGDALAPTLSRPTRPRCECRVITPIPPKFGRTGRSTTMWSAKPMPMRAHVWKN